MTQDFGEGAAGRVLPKPSLPPRLPLHSAETAKHVSPHHAGERAPRLLERLKAAPRLSHHCRRTAAAREPRKRLEIEATEAETVRLIFRLFLQGDGRSGPMGCEGYRLMAERHGHTFGKGLFYTELRSRDSHPQYLQRHHTTSTGTTAGPSAQDPRGMGCAGSTSRSFRRKTFQTRPECSLRTPPERDARQKSRTADVLLTGHCPLRMLAARLSWSARERADGYPLTMPVPSHRLKGSARLFRIRVAHPGITNWTIWF